MKNIKTSKKILLCLVFLILFAGCTNDSPNINTDLYSYQQFEGIFEKITSNFKVEGYKKIEDTFASPSVVSVDKALTFGKRDNLTVDGKPDGLSTQQRIVYSDKERIFILDFIYLNYTVGYDLLFSNYTPNRLQNSDLSKQTDENLFAFNNILIKTTLVWEGNQTISNLYKEEAKLNKALVSLLENIKKEKQ